MKDFSATAIRLEKQKLFILDQSQLPHQETWLESSTVERMIELIRGLQVRGAPLIGVAAALQVGLLAESGPSEDILEKAIWSLREARPTAVNLMNAMDRLYDVFKAQGVMALPEAAEQIRNEDEQLCLRIAEYGSSLIQDGENLLTHCNTGSLATAGVGTALGCILKAHQMGKKIHVYVDETRPLLQGGRLSTWELAQHKIPYTLICDNMAAILMNQRRVDRVLVGADRIATNGDFANKVGTYGLAVSAKFHSVPFYVVAPQTTVDKRCAHGADIPIEERSEHEVRGVKGSFGEVEWSPRHAPVWNPAFDVTPESLVSAWILDHGIFDREDVKQGVFKI